MRAAKITLANATRAASASKTATTVPFFCVLIDACIDSALLFDHIRLRQFRISLKRAPGFRSKEGADEVGEIAARPAVFEKDQKRHGKRRHDELHEDVERHPEHMRVAAHEVGKEIHQRCQGEHENQVLELQAKER